MKEDLINVPGAQTACPDIGDGEKFPVRARLIYYVSRKNITQYAFAATIGAPANYVSCVRNTMPGDRVAKIVKAYPDLNIAWLLTGVGNMYNKGYEAVAAKDAQNSKRRGRKANTLAQANETRRRIMHDGINADSFLKAFLQQLEDEAKQSDNTLMTLTQQRDELLDLLKMDDPQMALMVWMLRRRQEMYHKEMRELADRQAEEVKQLTHNIEKMKEELMRQLQDISPENRRTLEQQCKEKEQEYREQIDALKATLAMKDKQITTYMEALMKVAVKASEARNQKAP